MIHKKIKFKNEIYWLHQSVDQFHCNISPLNHYDKDGKLLADPFNDISYAILFGGKILRFSEEIGIESDLEEVNDNK